MMEIISTETLVNILLYVPVTSILALSSVSHSIRNTIHSHYSRNNSECEIFRSKLKNLPLHEAVRRIFETIVNSTFSKVSLKYLQQDDYPEDRVEKCKRELISKTKQMYSFFLLSPTPEFFRIILENILKEYLWNPENNWTVSLLSRKDGFQKAYERYQMQLSKRSNYAIMKDTYLDMEEKLLFVDCDDDDDLEDVYMKTEIDESLTVFFEGTPLEGTIIMFSVI
jgi:hypothetical protein